MGTIKEKALEKPISLVSYLLWGVLRPFPSICHGTMLLSLRPSSFSEVDNLIYRALGGPDCNITSIALEPVRQVPMLCPFYR